MASSFDAQFLNIPIRALNINGNIYPMVTREAKITRGAYLHDSIELSVLLSGTIQFNGKVRIPIDENLPLAGTVDVDTKTLVKQPVSFIYGVSPQTEQFLGYITGITAEEKFKEGLNLKLQLTGASVVLQRVVRRFETRVTIPEAAALRADAQSLGLIADAHEYRWPSVAQTTSTDWEMIASSAQLIGFLVFTWGAVVRLCNPMRLFKQYPYTTLTISDDLLENERKLMDFKPQEASSELIDKVGIEVFYFDSAGRVSSLKQPLASDKAHWVPYTQSPVVSREEAQVLIDAAASSSERWTQVASARIQGDAAIYPGVIVTITPGQADSQFAGRWLVVQVTHSMDRQAFQTQLGLARPKTFPNYDSSIFQHWWNTERMSKPTAFLRDDHWYSSIAHSTRTVPA